MSIGTFAMGSSVVGTLNLLQATLAIAIGCFIIGIALAVNGAAGYKYGIPFVVQARSAFGFAGTKFPGLVRAVPAIVWYGFQSWVGAGALNAVSVSMFGFDNLVFWFVVFQLLQIALSVLGFQGIKWLENIGSGFILVSLTYYGDDLPFWTEVQKTDGETVPHLVVPYTLDTNDMRFALPQGFSHGDEFFEYLHDAFDVMYAEGDERPAMMSIGMHCRLLGRPGRFRALQRFLDHVEKHDRVWVCRRADIARHGIEHHPYRPGA
ncbi:cytosine permease [Aromatoleum buckelii]|uniref:Allantoin permease n=1 Tax=Aromatoleum buckelii TaxID=200254 RepID=A0ABX1MYM0_9RHOO|nr:cytosine permease [Aromatoleum buckelii]MCK0512262.1 cytosine permease [Aromatoleum buckelii]